MFAYRSCKFQGSHSSTAIQHMPSFLDESTLSTLHSAKSKPLLWHNTSTSNVRPTSEGQGEATGGGGNPGGVVPGGGSGLGDGLDGFRVGPNLARHAHTPVLDSNVETMMPKDKGCKHKPGRAQRNPRSATRTATGSRRPNGVQNTRFSENASFWLHPILQSVRAENRSRGTKQPFLQKCQLLAAPHFAKCAQTFWCTIPPWPHFGVSERFCLPNTSQFCNIFAFSRRDPTPPWIGEGNRFVSTYLRSVIKPAIFDPATGHLCKAVYPCV